MLLDAPTGLLARQAEDGSHVVLRWHPPPGAPMASHIRYEVDVSAGSGAGGVQRVSCPPQKTALDAACRGLYTPSLSLARTGPGALLGGAPSSHWSHLKILIARSPWTKVEILEGRTECVLSNLRGGTLYTFAVRARMAEPSFGGFWSAWSEPAALLTASGERGLGGTGLQGRGGTGLTPLPPRPDLPTASPAPDLDPLILTLSLILVLILLLLGVLTLLSHRR